MAMVGARVPEEDMEDLLKTPSSDAFRFSEQEKRILQLWDREQELRLEFNLLKAQHEG
jgi:hypothetical protein